MPVPELLWGRQAAGEHRQTQSLLPCVTFLPTPGWKDKAQCWFSLSKTAPPDAVFFATPNFHEELIILIVRCPFRDSDQQLYGDSLILGNEGALTQIEEGFCGASSNDPPQLVFGAGVGTAGVLAGLWAGAPLLGCALSFSINSPRTGCSQLRLGPVWRNLFHIGTCDHGQALGSFLTQPWEPPEDPFRTPGSRDREGCCEED